MFCTHVIVNNYFNFEIEKILTVNSTKFDTKLNVQIPVEFRSKVLTGTGTGTKRAVPVPEPEPEPEFRSIYDIDVMMA